MHAQATRRAAWVIEADETVWTEQKQTNQKMEWKHANQRMEWLQVEPSYKLKSCTTASGAVLSSESRDRGHRHLPRLQAGCCVL
jgi:hypothetical protein